MQKDFEEGMISLAEIVQTENEKTAGEDLQVPYENKIKSIFEIASPVSGENVNTDDRKEEEEEIELHVFSKKGTEQMEDESKPPEEEIADKHETPEHTDRDSRNTEKIVEQADDKISTDVNQKNEHEVEDSEKVSDHEQQETDKTLDHLSEEHNKVKVKPEKLTGCVCIVCYKTSGANDRHIFNKTGRRRQCEIKRLLEKYANIQEHQGVVCRLCLRKMESIEKKIKDFKQWVQIGLIRKKNKQLWEKHGIYDDANKKKKKGSLNNKSTGVHQEVESPVDYRNRPNSEGSNKLVDSDHSVGKNDWLTGVHSEASKKEVNQSVGKNANKTALSEPADTDNVVYIDCVVEVKTEDGEQQSQVESHQLATGVGSVKSEHNNLPGNCHQVEWNPFTQNQPLAVPLVLVQNQAYYHEITLDQLRTEAGLPYSHRPWDNYLFNCSQEHDHNYCLHGEHLEFDFKKRQEELTRDNEVYLYESDGINIVSREQAAKIFMGHSRYITVTFTSKEIGGPKWGNIHGFNATLNGSIVMLECENCKQDFRKSDFSDHVRNCLIETCRDLDDDDLYSIQARLDKLDCSFIRWFKPSYLERMRRKKREKDRLKSVERRRKQVEIVLCHLCGGKYKKVDLGGHMKAVHCQYKQCHLCGASVKDLRSHMRFVKHSEDKAPEKQKRKHPQGRIKPVPYKSAKLENDIYICEVCGRHFSDLESLMEDKHKYYDCHVCRTKKKSRERFAFHKKNKHDEEETCEQCSELVRCADKRLHLLAEHLDTFKWICSICDKLFTTSESMKSHMWSGHGVKVQPKEELTKEISDIYGKVHTVVGLKQHFETSLVPEKVTVKQSADTVYPAIAAKTTDRKSADNVHSIKAAYYIVQTVKTSDGSTSTLVTQSADPAADLKSCRLNGQTSLSSRDQIKHINGQTSVSSRDPVKHINSQISVSSRDQIKRINGKQISRQSSVNSTKGVQTPVGSIQKVVQLLSKTPKVSRSAKINVSTCFSAKPLICRTMDVREPKTKLCKNLSEAGKKNKQDQQCDSSPLAQELPSSQVPEVAIDYLPLYGYTWETASRTENFIGHDNLFHQNPSLGIDIDTKRKNGDVGGKELKKFKSDAVKVESIPGCVRVVMAGEKTSPHKDAFSNKTIIMITPK